MSTNNKHSHHGVTEKELDNLLGQAFLNLDFNNPKSQELMDTVSKQYVYSSPVGFSIKKFILNKLIIGIGCLVIAVGLGIYFYPTSNTPHINYSVKNEISKTIADPAIESTKHKHILTEKEAPSKIVTKKEIQPTEPTQTNSSSVYLINNNPVIENNTEPTINTITSNEDSAYVYPALTEKEIKENHKRKREMVENLAKLSKKIYLPIPAGTFDYNDKKVSVNEFYMEVTEVTNLEYLTFVFDLLIQNRKQDFLKAKPDQSQWVKVFAGTYDFTDLKETYFSGKTYRDYPVVNISREGAEMYCRWLTNATNEYLASKNKPLMNDLRIPTNHEWTYAARSGTVTADFPWRTNVTQNSFGCFLANFSIKNFGEIKRDPKANCKYIYPNAITTAGTILGPMQASVLVAAYNPNDFGLYCMCGNVSEMVYEQDLTTKKTSHGTRGGSWYSDLDYLRLTSENEFKNITQPSPMIGFRPVFSVSKTHAFGSMERDNAETGLSSLTPEEITSALKEKKKMIEAVAKLNKEKFAYVPMGSCQYKNAMVSVQSFYMQTTEVTNLEYRTFLADLLIQNRMKDYLLAKPDQEMWLKKFPWSFNEPMRDMYFWHPAYDEYPVVNISRKGTELYCIWLTDETNKYLKENNKPLINDIRIPDEYEWAYAANNGKNKVKYANGNDYLRNNKGIYDVNYMCCTKEECRYDSTLKLYVPVSKKHDFMEDGAFHTVSTKSYALNKFGLYCMAGNVSEMVKEHLTGKPATKGGSWFSCDYFLEIDAEDEYPNEINASPLIGFRPVMTALKK